MDKPLFYGTAYYDEYMPYERIKDDFQLMKDAGINVIRIAESTWSSLEPHDGYFDFTHLHRMLDACSEYGMYAIVGTPTYAVPSWLVKKYPDVLADTFDGPSRYGHRQNMNLLHTGYLFHAQRIIRTLMEEVCNRPCVIGYQLDNETKSYDTAGIDVQKRFVEHLKEKFEDVNIFNQHFGLKFWSNSIDSWNDFPDIRGSINGSLRAEFRKFQRKIVTDFLAWQANIVNTYKRPDQFITHNFDYSWVGYSYGYQPEVDQFAAAAAVTIPGVDIYHPTGSHLTGAEISFGGCIGRALKKGPYFVLETQAKGLPAYSPYPGQLRLQAYSHLGSGAQMVEYWHWHSIHNSFESYWGGILGHNLRPGRTYHEIKRIGHEWNTYKKQLLIQEKAKTIVILIHNESLTGLEEFPISDQLTYNHILRWIFDSLYELNYECDFRSIYDSDWVDYPVVITPALYSLPDSVCQKLEQYVRNGGHLISTFKTAFSDEYLKIYQDEQPHALTKCFGMSYDLFQVPDHASLEADFTDKSAPISEWMELLEPQEADVLARYKLDYENNYAAITAHSYGKGSAYYIGCYFSIEVLKDLFRKILPECSLKALELSFPVIVKRGRNSEDRELIYVYNYSNSPKTLQMKQISPTPGLSYRNLFTNDEVTVSDPITIPCWDFVLLVSTETSCPQRELFRIT